MKLENKQLTEKNRVRIGCLFGMQFLAIELLESLRSIFQLNFIEITEIKSTHTQTTLDLILVDASLLHMLETYNKQELWNDINIPLFLLLREDETISAKMLTHPLVNKTIVVDATEMNLANTLQKAIETIQQEFKNQDTEILVANKKTEKGIALFLESVHTIIKINSEINHISTEEIASALFISPITLRRKIKKITGMTAVQYILHYRLQMAKFFLKNEGLNVQETAMKTGFMSNSYFTKSFKNTFGILPSNYIRI